jgi:hypothetical protein
LGGRPGLAVRFQEGGYLGVRTEHAKINRTVCREPENQARLKPATAFIKIGLQLANAQTLMKVRLADGDAHALDDFADQLAFLPGERPDLIDQSVVKANL